MSEARVRRLIVAATAVLAVGCAAIPDSGSVHVGRPVPAPGGLGDIDVRVLPAAAQPGLAPIDVVHGFLRALVNDDSDYEIARTYLSRRAAPAWRPGTAVTEYDDSTAAITVQQLGPASRRLVLHAPRLGDIDARGNFTARGGAVTATYDLIKQDGQWRIDRLTSGNLLLSALDVQRSFRPAFVYYLNRFGTTLVPEQVLLRPTPRGATTALVRALLDGPGTWLAPSVHTGFPSGTTLLGNVPVDPNGVAEVNLSSAVRQASSADLKALSAQLVWTLRQVSDISDVRVLADGSPLPVPGVPSLQPRTAWRTFNPAAPPAPLGVYASGGSWQFVEGSESGLAQSAAGLSALAISHDGERIAGLVIRRRTTTLYVGAAGAQPVARVTARAISQPTFDPSGTVFAVVTRRDGRSVVAVPATGPVQRIAVSGPLLGAPVQRLALSRDGARIAAVVGRAGRGRLLMGRVVEVRRAGQTRSAVLRFQGFRDLLPRIVGVRGIAWDGGDQLLATLANTTGGRELVAVDIDGFATRSIPTTGVRGQPVDIAAAPGEPMLVTAAGSVWRSDATGGWVRVAFGNQPTYPG